MFEIETEIKFTTRLGTTAVAEFHLRSPIRERANGELVHWRKDEDVETCAACGTFAQVWLGSKTSHEEHPMRCTTVSPSDAGAFYSKETA